MISYRITRALPTECPVCGGLGYNNPCRAQMQTRFDIYYDGEVEEKTLQQGSGCLRCGGTGQIP